MAFSVWRIEDDCLQAAPKIKINYKGPDPFGLAERMLEVARSALGIKKIDMWETDFRWESLPYPRRFYLRAYAPKALDHRTIILIEFVFNGTQPESPKESGPLTLEIAARLLTQYPLKGVFQQSFFYRMLLKAYHQATYAGQRSRYLTTCTELVEKVASELRKLI